MDKAETQINTETLYNVYAEYFNCQFRENLFVTASMGTGKNYNLTKFLENLSNKIKDTTLIGLETSERDDIVIPENLNLLQKKTYGKTIIYFLKLS